MLYFNNHISSKRWSLKRDYAFFCLCAFCNKPIKISQFPHLSLRVQLRLPEQHTGDMNYCVGSWQDVLEKEWVASYSLHVNCFSQRRLALLFLPHNIPRCVKSCWTVDTILPACSITILSLTDTSHLMTQTRGGNKLSQTLCVCREI